MVQRIPHRIISVAGEAVPRAPESTARVQSDLSTLVSDQNTETGRLTLLYDRLRYVLQGPVPTKEKEIGVGPGPESTGLLGLTDVLRAQQLHRAALITDILALVDPCTEAAAPLRGSKG